MTQLFSSQWSRLSTVAAITLLLAACGKGQQAAAPAPASAAKPANPPVAVVDGTPIPRDAFDDYLKGLLRGKPVTDVTAEEKNQVLDQMISMQLIANQAAKDGMDKDPAVAARLDLARVQVLADAGVQKYLKAIAPSDAELHADYDAFVATLDKSEYHASHILVAAKDKDLAISLTKKLKAGAKFDELAKANSIDPGSKAMGGDLGWFTLSNMVKPFGDAVKSLKKGETTQQPVETQYGWHIVKLDDVRETVPPTFDQHKAQSNSAVIQKKFKDYIESLKKTAKIEKSL
ncbi:MAG: peptidylprolyl isomerase [Pseudomonadota bacterium]|nr:peptidylprolyl isomerase [Pseudomonadota bacterium]